MTESNEQSLVQASNDRANQIIRVVVFLLIVIIAWYALGLTDFSS